MKKIDGFKVYRHKDNPKEKEFHDNFITNHLDSDISNIIFPPKGNGFTPSEYLTEREERIVITAIQWLGSPVGQSFLKTCGFHLKE